MTIQRPPRTPRGQRFPRRQRLSRGQGGSLKPIIGILTAVLAVQAYQHWGMPALPDGGVSPVSSWAEPAQGTFLSQGMLPSSFIEGVLSLSGVGVEPERSWTLDSLFAMQSPTLRQAAEAMRLAETDGGPDTAATLEDANASPQDREPDPNGSPPETVPSQAAVTPQEMYGPLLSRSGAEDGLPAGDEPSL
ncbi:MAG: hypothetical protein LBI19_09265, partial [Oscillospiraceae bacterium]|nr:hypothetical protein [Oscillospiraceae bacterium]